MMRTELPIALRTKETYKTLPQRRLLVPCSLYDLTAKQII